MSSSSDSGRIARPRAIDRAGTVTAVAEALFDELTRQAAEVCGMPISALCLVDSGHHWFKSRGRVTAADTPRALLLCSEAIRSPDGLLLTDLEQDERFPAGPEPGGVRFFAGVPIVTSRAGAIGTLSVMDGAPREDVDGLLESLQELAREAGRQFDIRLGAQEVLARATRTTPSRPDGPANAVPAELEFRNLVEQAPVGTYVIQAERFRYANPKLGEILGYAPGELAGAEVAPLIVEADRPAVLARIRGLLVGEAPSPYGFRAIRKDGEIVDVEAYESATEVDGRQSLIGTLLDITERKRAEAQAAERAFVDPLTRLPNRARFLERLEIELAQSRRYERKLAVLHVDLDAFKFVNDNWGHGAGDRLLQSLAIRMTRGVREVDTIARIGGDEFLILVPDLRQTGDMSHFAQKLLTLLGRPVELDEHTLQVTASVGIATYPDDGQDAEALLRNADAAMYRAKDLGGNNFELCTPELTAMAVERLELQNGLRLALDRNEFLLHYQPLVSLGSGRIVGLEALVRWQHPHKGFLPPATFIPVAEETGLILPLGDWVLRAATAQLKTWLATGLGLRISVNFSAKQFRERSLIQTVESALSRAGLEPRHLEVEITESIAMEGAETVNANLNLLRAMGCGIAIDDFGTGYSSMSYLKSFPITSLKVDRSFVTDLAANPADAGIVRAIVEMAHGLSLSVIAEGVETQDQFQLLQKYGCDEMQGYWVSRPLPVDGVDRKLEEELVFWSRGL
ncbi:MAG TPA: EAL domain-containing protein [Thermoanaerobaculia bacterium]|jgi:diguanylate cyclase (GGDEF)-like protein/PAS domain S-box-containing protein|nr:EAL domain-containing protein [Thermoanaerobaculia bacterium]